MRYQLINPVNDRYTVVDQVLHNRGIEDITRFKFPTEKEFNDPLLLDNMEQGAKILISHIANEDPILVVVDEDCDGYTSASALINYLNWLFPHYVQTKLIYRVHNSKQHGIILDAIPEEVKLVIAPDSSSDQSAEHKALYKRGVEVLVLDHHATQTEPSPACIINNQLCDYPNKTLSGAGVVYKFCCYIDSLLNTSYADEIADLAAVGCLADVMKLTDLETRALIECGTKEFKNPLLKTMVEKDDFHFGGKELTPFNITWYIAPYINAVTRSGTPQERMLVFESMLDFKGYCLIPSTKRGCAGQMETMVEQAVRTCTNVKKRQSNLREEADTVVFNLIEKNNLTVNKILAIQLEPEYAVDKNLTGLIATTISSAYQRPCLILNKVIEEDGKVFWRGSGRGYDNANLGSFREALLESGLVEYAAGHDSAMGVSFPAENYDRLVEYFNERYKDFDCTPIYNVDFIWTKPKGADVIEIVNAEKLWGKGVDAPVVAIEGLRIFGDNINLYGLDKGRPTLNIKLEDCELVKFKSSEKEYDTLHSDLGYVIINAVGTCSKSNWGIPQIQIIEYEIIGRQEYYF